MTSYTGDSDDVIRRRIRSVYGGDWFEPTPKAHKIVDSRTATDDDDDDDDCPPFHGPTRLDTWDTHRHTSSGTDKNKFRFKCLL